ncbi:hypothetical protein FRX31_027277, partial [Thalictrum thalictroides]
VVGLCQRRGAGLNHSGAGFREALTGHFMFAKLKRFTEVEGQQLSDSRKRTTSNWNLEILEGLIL